MESLDPIYALNQIPHPVVIVTVGEYGVKGKYNGMTAAWVSRVSWDPPLVMVSISPKRFTWKLINEYKEFAVNIVPKSLIKQAVDVFGSMSGREVDKFEVSGVKVEKGRKIKAPVILNASVVIECTVENIVEAGDHYIVIGRAVEAYKISDEKPTIWHMRKPYSLGEEIELK
ncbi:MAG: flavin reductase family protein [archaeon GB-1867-005]|nr:flavin reductase family protein [Candidatus Culexmicrobium cathedralense]